MLHTSVEDFWITTIAFYDEGVYFLAKDGYLNYNMDKESEIGEKYNPEISYCRED
ncbi:MAG: hypothetical protein K2J77_07680 [Oscillospiraceae bacterium]|nr:hypothetical protein [Oscillospiraceae bacterium]